jgi:hypothetical protein
VLQSRLDRIAFAAVLIVNNDFSAGVARALSSLVVRAIINHENVIELVTSSANDVPDMFLLLISRNDCGGLRTNLSERIALGLYHRRTTG